MGDFNIDVKKKGTGYKKLDEFCITFGLKNIVNRETCFKGNHKSTIDLILTNKPLSFHKTIVTETELSDFHNLTSLFFKSHYTRLKPKIMKYRNYKNFEERAFLEDLEKTDFLTS